MFATPARPQTPPPPSKMMWFVLLTALQISFCRATPARPDPRDPVADYRSDVAAVAGREFHLDVAAYPRVNTVAIQNFIASGTVTVVTEAVPTGTVQILPTPLVDPDTVGQLYTKLESAGHDNSGPLLTQSIPSPTQLISPSASATGIYGNTTTKAMQPASSNIFGAPVATGAPPASMMRRSDSGGIGSLPQTSDHPVPRLGIQQTAPISTNKFFQNFFLGSQASGTWLHPYSIAWAKGQGVTSSWGMAVSHIESSQFAFGPTNAYGAASYFINPVGIQSLVLSAAELGSGTSLTSANITDMSAVIQLRPSGSSIPAIEFPLVQGSGFVTAVYNGATPEIQTGVFLLNMTKVNTQPRPGVTKYLVDLNDGKRWLLYATSTDGSSLDLQVINNGLIRSNSTFSGTIQIAKDPNGAGEVLYDAACGAYATGVTMTGTSNGLQGTYSFFFQKSGLSGAPLLMFGLPHHVASYDSTTSAAVQSTLRLQTTTKGMATAVVADSWTMVESRLPVSINFLPWSSAEGAKKQLSATAKATILQVAQSELSQNMSAQTDLNSMYYSGKALAKFAMILVVVNDMLGETGLAAAGLAELKEAFALFATNTQQFPLVYESGWGGVVSSASYTTGDPNVDFGNSYYNDHHFHYGYHVLAAAIIAHLDSAWLTDNADYVNTLVRDYANPCASDEYFPVSRMFDWYHGHSFAHGLFESADGRDQESSSEDVMASYAIKMWGLVSGDANMAARGNLMLAVQQRALNMYYYYTSDNTVQPANFIGNRAAGILFENKIDHATYFGTNIEYIQGIHMLPLIPATAFTRGTEFVKQEWEQHFANGIADSVVGGWKGILFGNLATIDPSTAYAFFSQSGFDSSWLDGGASLTWYLAYAAALGGL